MASQSNYRILKRSEQYSTEEKKLWNIWRIKIFVTMNITRMRKDTRLHDFNQETPRGCYPRTVIIFTSSLWHTKISTYVGSHLTKYFHRQYSAVRQIRTLRFSPEKMGIDAVSILAGLRSEARNNKWTCWPHGRTVVISSSTSFSFKDRKVELDDTGLFEDSSKFGISWEIRGGSCFSTVWFIFMFYEDEYFAYM